jgi:NADP-dependent aldehyde dehydrogenase
MLAGDLTEKFVADVKQRFESGSPAPLLGSGVLKSLGASVAALLEAGATVVTGGRPVEGACSFNNTLLRVSADQFLRDPEKLQTEAFGNVSLMVVARDIAQAQSVIEHLEGNLTGCLYTSTAGSDEDAYAPLAPLLRRKVGRLLNDKMPTGVAVSPAMNHGGPYPATGHPGFTAVGIPASLRRFGMLQCFDNVREDRLPGALRNRSPNGKMWRLIDGAWTRGDVA